jgi:hypothetical protein
MQAATFAQFQSLELVEHRVESTQLRCRADVHGIVDQNCERIIFAPHLNSIQLLFRSYISLSPTANHMRNQSMRLQNGAVMGQDLFAEQTSKYVPVFMKGTTKVTCPVWRECSGCRPTRNTSRRVLRSAEGSRRGGWSRDRSRDRSADRKRRSAEARRGKQ